MRYRQLGHSDVIVSEIALGTWLTFGLDAAPGRAAATVHAALDHGITLFDTANVYGGGEAERRLGAALADVPRHSVVIASKLFFPMPSGERGLSRTQIVRQLEGSLRRLGTDYIDLYQCHRHDPETPLEETLEAMGEVIRQGKVRAIGFSEWPAERIRAALAVPGVPRFAASQPRYSLIDRRVETDIVPLCRDNGIAQLAFSPLAQGVLTGKYRSGIPAESRGMQGDPDFPGHLLHPALRRALGEVEILAAATGATLAQIALAWVLREPGVAAAIVGASRPEQVVENAAASDLSARLDPALLDEAGRIILKATREAELAAFVAVRRQKKETP